MITVGLQIPQKLRDGRIFTIARSSLVTSGRLPPNSNATSPPSVSFLSQAYQTSLEDVSTRMLSFRSPVPKVTEAGSLLDEQGP